MIYSHFNTNTNVGATEVTLSYSFVANSDILLKRVCFHSYKRGASPDLLQWRKIFSLFQSADQAVFFTKVPNLIDILGGFSPVYEFTIPENEGAKWIDLNIVIKNQSLPTVLVVTGKGAALIAGETAVAMLHLEYEVLSEPAIISEWDLDERKKMGPALFNPV